MVKIYQFINLLCPAIIPSLINRKKEIKLDEFVCNQAKEEGLDTKEALLLKLCFFINLSLIVSTIISIFFIYLFTVLSDMFKVIEILKLV